MRLHLQHSSVFNTTTFTRGRPGQILNQRLWTSLFPLLGCWQRNGGAKIYLSIPISGLFRLLAKDEIGRHDWTDNQLRHLYYGAHVPTQFSPHVPGTPATHRDRHTATHKNHMQTKYIFAEADIQPMTKQTGVLFSVIPETTDVFN